jgi:hypothetical protein
MAKKGYYYFIICHTFTVTVSIAPDEHIVKCILLT